MTLRALAAEWKRIECLCEIAHDSRQGRGPSPDQLGTLWFAAPCVTRCRIRSPRLIVQICQNPSSSTESNAMRRPSGDHAGEHCSRPGALVSCDGADPSLSAVPLHGSCRDLS